MTSKQANVNYQERALSFRVGDRVTIPGSSSTQIGVVLHVWAAIGIVDVEWSHGARRMNVEDIIRVDDKGVGLPPDTNNLPVDIVPPLEKANPQKLATAFLKNLSLLTAHWWLGVMHSVLDVRGSVRRPPTREKMGRASIY